jgi:hypothetical protein
MSLRLSATSAGAGDVLRAGPFPSSDPTQPGSAGVVMGAALLARSGQVYTGCSVTLPAGEASPAAIRQPAEQVALVKALSDGDDAFAALFLVSNSEREYLPPARDAAAALAAYGDFPVYLVRADRTFIMTSTGQLVDGAVLAGAARAAEEPALAPAQSPARATFTAAVASPTGSPTRGAALSSSSASLASSTGGAGYDGVHAGVPVWQWSVPDVTHWLDVALGLPQYQHRFREAAVDGPVLLSLRDSDLAHLLSIQHPLHRRKLELGITKLRERGKRGRTDTTWRTGRGALSTTALFSDPSLPPHPRSCILCVQTRGSGPMQVLRLTSATPPDLRRHYDFLPLAAPLSATRARTPL